MGKKDTYYFDNFVLCADCALRAAQMLEKTLENYNPDAVLEQMNKIHEIEHEGDGIKHETMSKLVKEFLPPIEREDIIEISQHIDDVIDMIDDVFMRFYTYDVKTVREDAIAFTNIIVKCCETLKEIMEEFVNFKKSSKLREKIIEINNYEDEGDRMYIANMHKLFETVTDTKELIAWREIYNYMEKCADSCEDVADAIESVVLKNA